MLIVKVETLHLDHAWHKMILTLFLVSLRLNIKLLYLFLYLLSVSLYKWKSSRSIFFASSEALSTEMFKSESFNLKCGKCTRAIIKCPDFKKCNMHTTVESVEKLTSVRGFLSENHAHFSWLPPETRVSLKPRMEPYVLTLVSLRHLWRQSDKIHWVSGEESVVIKKHLFHTDFA